MAQRDAEGDHRTRLDHEGSRVGKIVGLVTALNVIPFVDPTLGVIVFTAASILKDTVNRTGDLLDDSKPN